MKKRTLIAACLLAAMSAGAQSQVSGIDKKNMDLSVKPGTDFYQYAAGGWLKSHPLDAEHTNNGAFTDLYEENQKRIQELILEYASKPQKQGTLEQKIGTLYNMLMDSVRLNREGWEPLKPTLARIAAIKTNKEYQLVTAELDRRGENTMMFGVGVGADMRNASMNIVSVGQGGLGLGTRDYYLNNDPQTLKVREAYKTYLKNLFKMVGNDEATATKKVDAIMAIETRIAKVSYSKVQLRDIDKNYHKMSYNDLVLNFPGIDWGNVFLQTGFPPFDAVDVGQPEPIHEVEKILVKRRLPCRKLQVQQRVKRSTARPPTLETCSSNSV